MYRCCFPECSYETENRSLIEFHHIHPRELFTQVGKKVTIPLCPTHHKMIYHEDATSGQHAERHPGSMCVKTVTNTNRGKCVIFEDMEGNEHLSMLDETPSTSIMRLAWDIVHGLTDEAPDEIEPEIEAFVDDDGFFDDGSSVYYKDGFRKVATKLLSKHIEAYMTKAKSEFDLALEKARNDWKSLH